MTEVTQETVAQALAAPLRQPNDADAATVRDFLVKLLMAVWTEGEGFNGKRPFGNSSWELDIEVALVDANLVQGRMDEDGYLEEVDSAAVDEIVGTAIGALGPDRTAGLMPMGLEFDDADPVARCLVVGCRWHGHGDSMVDAVTAWTHHLARDHRDDWPEE